VDISHQIYLAPNNIEEVKHKWKKLSYAIFNLTPKLTQGLIYEQIDSAFKIWAKHCKLKFKKMNPNNHCDIKISFCQKILGAVLMEQVVHMPMSFIPVKMWGENCILMRVKIEQKNQEIIYMLSPSIK